MSTDHILGMVPDLVEDDDNAEEEKEHCDHPLESISIGVLDTRSFLFFYDEDDNKENMKAMASKGQKVQRSNSEEGEPERIIVTILSRIVARLSRIVTILSRMVTILS